MADDGFERDIYDLNYKRPEVTIGIPWVHYGTRRVKGPMTETATAMSERRKRLDQVSKQLRQQLQRKDALVFCLHILTCSFDSTINRAPDLGHASSLLPRSRPDMDCEEEIINARLAAARNDFADKLLATSLKLIGSQVESRSQTTCVEEPRIFYRFTHAGSHTFFDEDIGFCCGRWLRERKFEPSTKEDFANHMKPKMEDFESPFISLSDSPCRVLRFGNKNAYNAAEVIIIDASKLRSAKVHFERTTKWAPKRGIRLAPGQIPYITESHWLAWPCVPSSCIVRRVPFHQFEEVCNQNDIFGDYGVASNVDKKLDLCDFEKISPKKHGRISVYLGFAPLEDDNNAVDDEIAKQLHKVSLHEN